MRQGCGWPALERVVPFLRSSSSHSKSPGSLNEPGLLNQQFDYLELYKWLPFVHSFRTWLTLPPWEQEPALWSLFQGEEGPLSGTAAYRDRRDHQATARL